MSRSVGYSDASGSDNEETMKLRANTLDSMSVFAQNRSNKTAQLLFLGASLALSGLGLSLFMLGFRSTCDRNFAQSDYVVWHDEWTMCKQDIKGEKVDPGEHPRLNGRVIGMPGRGCTRTSDCSDMPGSFCTPTEDVVKTEGICAEVTCHCSRMIYDCGIRQYFDWTFRAADFIPDCDDPDCTSRYTIHVPYWTDDISDLSGCHTLRRTTLQDTLRVMQKEVEKQGIIQPFATNASLWKELGGYVEHTPDVHFTSFWPSTISESVSNGFSPEGRIFFGLMLAAALCLKASEYTKEIKSVELPGMTVPILMIEWDTLRAWLPPIGLIILSIVQMVPESEILDINQGLMTLVHLIGAQFCFVVYLVCEAVALWDPRNREEISQPERVARFGLFCMGACAMATFATTYSALFFLGGPANTPYVRFIPSGRKDMYVAVASLHKTFRVRAAAGIWKTLKVISYAAEYGVALSILLSHLVIWMFFEKGDKGVDEPSEEE